MNSGPQRRIAATKLRAARRSKPRRRAEIAREMGVSEQTLSRRMKIFETQGRIDRKSRNDRGRPRVLSGLWAAITFQIFANSTAASWAHLHREIAARCLEKGRPAPSYYWIRRRINDAFRRVMSGGRIRRIGNFVRDSR